MHRDGLDPLDSFRLAHCSEQELAIVAVHFYSERSLFALVLLDKALIQIKVQGTATLAHAPPIRLVIFEYPVLDLDKASLPTLEDCRAKLF